MLTEINLPSTYNRTTYSNTVGEFPLCFFCFSSNNCFIRSVPKNSMSFSSALWETKMSMTRIILDFTNRINY